MDRLSRHVLRGLAVVLGLSATASAAQQIPTSVCGVVSLSSWWNILNTTGNAGTIIFATEGEAYRACNNARLAYPQYHHPIQGAILLGGQGTCQVSTTINRSFQWISAPFGQTGTLISNCSSSTYTESPRQFQGPNFRWTNSCATQPISLNWVWDHYDYTHACKAGCEMEFSPKVCDWYGPPENRVFSCAADARPTGRVCHGDGKGGQSPPPPDPQPPPDPPPPDPQPPPDPPPPDPPPPEDPPPDPPPPDPGTGDGGDGIDDGQQVVQGLTPRLTAIEAAVLGLGPRIDQVRAGIEAARSQANANAGMIASGIEGARADANADADRIVGAIDGVRQAIEGQGGEGGLIDLSALAPGPDGGEHTPRDAVVEYGSASALLAQLDRDGFGMTRTCPAHSWTQTFDLGWASLDFRQASQLICWALSILGWMIALGGLIQASFILSRIGTR